MNRYGTTTKMISQANMLEKYQITIAMVHQQNMQLLALEIIFLILS